MNLPRREMLGLLVMGTLAGCSSSDTSDDGGSDSDDSSGSNDGDTSGTPTGEGLPDGGSGGSSGTSLAGSCAANFGDTMEQYDTSGRGMVATFSHPMGGEVTYQEDSEVGHITAFSYGRGEVRSLHSLTVSEDGPYNDTSDAMEAYGFDDRVERGSARTYDGQTHPVAILRREDSVTYIVRVQGPDGYYEFGATTGAGEAEPCLDTYESVTRGVIESLQPV